MSDAPQQWPSPWVRAALDAAALATLASGPLHGYAIAQALAAHGFGLLKGGSLYPVLNRLEESDAVTATWVEGHGGPGRREYALTATGRQQLDRDLAAWERLVETMRTMSRDNLRPMAHDG